MASSLSTWLRYVTTKVVYSFSLYQKTHGRVDAKCFDTIVKTILVGKVTFLHQNKAEEVAPTIGTEAGTFLVRRIPYADPTNVFVGDLVVLKDPMNSDKYLVRRLAAIEGHEMASTDKKDEPFVLEDNECWVLADNEDSKPKDSYDSRSFGPVTLSDIVGRAIYCLKNDVDHGPVNNSDLSAIVDSPVLAVELDVDELKKNNRQ
ncbi:mitochondrial ATP-independent inner membrane protease subunit 2-like [Salvia miltiorrhiza]|uniref:mitochondrial ATP-independent inner membrane protease subunit 2-like n=1 Tax=Salvia miltiorrhiza TaxID=226208 RepID=UPI0025AD5014|nr:mitochondrial ATP-independent inner membrane protease subunit 2-like [Salvia miltiorrhiza]XP_057781457.1 mitochondrial ATP-independent inner membrane protease subunit 2-like [Salvia miltiorrhiza]